MTGSQLRAIRDLLGLSRLELALALGYQGKDRSNYELIAAMERGVKPIPPRTAMCAQFLLDRKADFTENLGST
jgi:hypothetical protein